MNALLPGIRARRQAAGLTLEELAAAVGCTLQAVSCWERGATLPTADRLPAIAEALGCSIDELYADNTGGEACGTEGTEKEWELT